MWGPVMQLVARNGASWRGMMKAAGSAIQGSGVNTRTMLINGGAHHVRGYTKDASEPCSNSSSPPPASPETLYQKIIKQNMQQVAKPSQKQRRVFSALVQNEPGVLSRISGLISARGFNIDSLVVGGTDVPNMSRMTLVFYDTENVAEQLRAQLEDLVPVWAVLDYTSVRKVERELLLVKVSLDEQSPELALDQRRAQNRRALSDLATLFDAKIIDISHQAVTIEMATWPSRVKAFIGIVRPYGIIEASRTGSLAMVRSLIEEDPVEEEREKLVIDPSMLPPG
eukprot:Nk52_evm4s376 gene=Nk52_evmTU4s376